jgi:hypothetical protein
MSKPVFACFFALALVLGSASLPSNAGTRTDIPSAASPKAFWRTVMEHFYGDYDRSLKCWIGTFEGERHCMRPHRLDTVSADGVTRFHIVVGGYRVDDVLGQDHCHACTGSLGLIVLEQSGEVLDLVARNSLVLQAGSWGDIPPEDSFRLREIGDGRYGWTMDTVWAGQGYIFGSVFIYGVSGSDIIQLGRVPVHADNSGTCGEGMGACSEHAYELVFDPGSGASFHDIVLRKQSGDADDPESFRVPFDDKALQYKVPDEVDALFSY